MSKNRSLNLPLFALAYLLFAIFSQADSLAQPHCEEDPKRVLQAQKLIAQAKDFKLKVAKYHGSAAAQTNDAKRLSADAQKLERNTKKLNASIKENVKLDGQFKLGTKQYQLHLDEFRKHSKLYNAHLAEYESQLHQIQIANGQLQSTCKEYADHAQRYHIPGLRPPHVCLQLQWEQKDMQRTVKGYQEDQVKVQKAEAALAQQEAKLAQATKEHAALEKQMLAKANLDELERTQGFMLLKEYDQIEREYRMLFQEQKSLSPASGTKPKGSK